jgi:hypothetical protein
VEDGKMSIITCVTVNANQQASAPTRKEGLNEVIVTNKVGDVDAKLMRLPKQYYRIPMAMVS